MLPSLSEIKKRRIRMSLTQSRLAKEVGISQSMLAKIEANKVAPSYDVARRIFEHLNELESKVRGSAKDVQTENIVSVYPDDMVGKAIKLMGKHGFSQLPVLDRDSDLYVGSIVDKGLVNMLLSTGKPDELYRKKIKEVMNLPFPILDENAPLQMIACILQHTPAVLTSRKGRVIGIVTNSDMLKAIVRDQV